MLNAGSTALEQYCNQEGVNNIIPWTLPVFGIPFRGRTVARIGLLANNENDCLTPDSLLGFGLKMAFDSPNNQILLSQSCGGMLILLFLYLFPL
jgi:hypothetical protein